MHVRTGYRGHRQAPACMTTVVGGGGCEDDHGEQEVEGAGDDGSLVSDDLLVGIDALFP